MSRTIKQYLLGLTICFCHLIAIGQSAVNKTDSLLTLLKTDKADTIKLEHLNQLSEKYFNTGSNDSALLYANSALELGNILLKETGGQKIKATVQTGISVAYNNIAGVYFSEGNYSSALKNCFASLKIYETMGNQKQIAAAYNNIGSIYYSQGNFTEALKNHSASLKIKETIDDKKGIAYSYGNIGNVYSALGNYPEALKNNLAALKIAEEIRDQRLIGNTYNNIGNIYAKQLNYTEALKNHLVSLKIAESLGDKGGVDRFYVNIGTLLTKQKKYKEAEVYLIKAKKLSKEIDYKECLKATYSALTELDSARGNYKGAYENSKLYILYRDSIDNEVSRKKTVQNQMTYDFEKREAVADAEHKKELENQQTLSEEKSRKQKIVIVFVVVGLLLVLVFAGFVFRSLRVTRKQKTIIEEQKQLVEVKQKEILDSIYYAGRIQRSLLPTEKYIDKNLQRLKG